MSIIDQKEYLKKYLSLGDEKQKNKKRKKKAKVIRDRVKIIDDDLDLPTNYNESELKEFLTAEDAPQVVGIVDERPLSMRIDDYRKSDKWKLVGSDEELKNNSRGDTDSDASPVRCREQKHHDEKKKGSANYDSDISCAQQRRSRRDSDASPPRKSGNKYDSDASPPRKSGKQTLDSDTSPPRRKSKKYDDDSDPSPPPRNNTKKYDSDTSPPRKSNQDATKSRNHYSDSSQKKSKTTKSSQENDDPPAASKSTRCHPSRFTDNTDLIVADSSSSSVPPDQPHHRMIKNSLGITKKLTKTLDGKRAGLQAGGELKIETAALKRREAEMFENMSAEISGKDAVPIMRDRRTGKKRDLEQEAIAEYEKQQRENVQKEKYDRWGKGLKQVQDHREKVEQDLHEMSKPLARYADDEDLEKYLKEQEREGDPMLQYIRKKKRKHAVDGTSAALFKPQYEGEFMPNRFGIAPGYRWDGVDRSNGYEKQWFQIQNSRKAVEEEVYKWSTEDM